MNIYFDTCALNRLTDDLSQPRVRAEADAVENILGLVAAGQMNWLTSVVVQAELSRNPDAMKRAQSLPLLDLATSRLELTPMAIRRAQVLKQEGLDALDALHLALSEEARMDWLITVDDRFIARAMRRASPALPQVINPVEWFQRRSEWLLKP